MQKVVTVNLNGTAWQLDEDAYEALRAYLSDAERELAANPDRTEIIADLEQAIADKCSRFVGAHKNVVSAPEITQVIEEMGPVRDPNRSAEESGAGSSAQAAQERPADSPGPVKRLYRVPEGALIAGVCMGIAAYFGWSVTVVRLVFIALAVLTSGAWILAYIILMFAIPEATTAEERAAAHGWPFNAQELIESVKTYASRGAEALRGVGNDAATIRRHRRRAHRERIRAMRAGDRWHARHAPGGGEYVGQVLAGIMVPIVNIVSAALFVALLLTVFSLVFTGSVAGWSPPEGTPVWVLVPALFVLYAFIAWPLHYIGNAPVRDRGAVAGWLSFWAGIVWLAFTALFLWLAYEYLPGVEEFIDNLPESLPGRTSRAVRDSFFVAYW